MEDIYIYDALHTPLTMGRPGGKLNESLPLNLVTQLLRTLHRRNKLPTQGLGALYLSCTQPIQGQGGNISRLALLSAGYPPSANGYCFYGSPASGWNAFQTAYSTLLASRQGKPFQIFGGLDSFSRLSQFIETDPWSYALEQLASGNILPPILHADLLATRHAFTKQELEDYTKVSIRSANSKAGKAILYHRLQEICDPNGLTLCKEYDFRPYPLEDSDPSPPEVTDLDRMAQKYYPELEHIHHVHDEKSVAQFADGAALLLIGRPHEPATPMKPVARILALSEEGAPPENPFSGMETATRQVLEQTKIDARKVESWVCSEPFASVGLQYKRAFNIPNTRFNVAGGELCIGLPGGASVAFLLCRLLSTLEQKDQKIGLAVLGTSNGEAGACIIERLS